MAAPSETPTPDPDGDRPSRAIIAAIARHEGVDVTAVEPPAYEPLYSVVDPAALDEIFRGDTPTTTLVTLEYAGYEIAVSDDGRVEATDPSTGETVTRRFRG
ncbi:HalOD1 output domain-containing protein [Natronococcus jeotgali]|uniref:Halobacterial output domain-containing protein n=1 Tax=Natronococcus jeotgali DSM 18795 TaxID=1227498 RepID=L9WX13_9EURY|nr:HalOD1 output domain-containing protein [Natronococcus jeotgali]ELY53957.1 hypothetical protein C492_16848 [Natronococcus jeotgali DSM 18795]